jgi:hypothetical protein
MSAVTELSTPPLMATPTTGIFFPFALQTSGFSLQPLDQIEVSVLLYQRYNIVHPATPYFLHHIPARPTLCVTVPP